MSVDDHLDVALFEPDDEYVNTIVLPGVDVLVPLARDLDQDPLHDDEVRLLREDGHYEVTLTAGHEDVEENGDHELLYRFRDVPPGLYRISVNVAGQWSDVMTGVVVRRGGVFFDGKTFGSGKPEPAPPIGKDDDDEEDDYDPLKLEPDPFVDEM